MKHLVTLIFFLVIGVNHPMTPPTQEDERMVYSLNSFTGGDLPSVSELLGY